MDEGVDKGSAIHIIAVRVACSAKLHGWGPLERDGTLRHPALTVLVPCGGEGQALHRPLQARHVALGAEQTALRRGKGGASCWEDEEKSSVLVAVNTKTRMAGGKTGARCCEHKGSV